MVATLPERDIKNNRPFGLYLFEEMDELELENQRQAHRYGQKGRPDQRWLSRELVELRDA